MKVIIRKATQGYLDRWLWVPKPYITLDATKSALTHVLSDGYTGKERLLYLWRESHDHLLVPRAFWDPVRLPFPVVDCRPQHYPHIPFQHRIFLDHRPEEVNGKVTLQATGKTVQQQSVQALYNAPGGVLQLACGRGKTVIALYKIATAEVPALVMCDNTNLLYQWQREAERMLDVPGGIGIFGDGRREWQKGLVLATYHSIANWADTIPEEARQWFGQIFWDEGHHVGAPTFATTAEMFYGNRYSLTATPERDDGLHIITDVHVGKVLFKDLTPTMTPRFGFFWSGFELDMKDPQVVSQCLDINQEVHLSKVQTFFGRWIPRLTLINDLVRMAYQNNRTVLVLSNSVDEVVNLMSIFEFGTGALNNLYTDIPVPTPAEFGETLTPIELSNKEMTRYGKKEEKLLGQLEKVIAKCGQQQLQQQLKDVNTRLDGVNKELMKKKLKRPEQRKLEAAQASLTSEKRELIEQFNQVSTVPEFQVAYAELTQIEQAYHQHKIARKIQNELEKRQRAYILALVSASQNSGLLTYEVPQEKRSEALAEKKVIFAVTKYGKEGMDCPRLDTVILSSLFSSRNGLQQLLGRPTRPMPGKKTPTLVAVVDNVGQCIGMSKKLVQHLRDWPKDEGGPYNPIFVGYPWTRNNQISTIQTLLGP